MSNAAIPRMQGDDYQARFFWLQACRLFEEHSKVVRVGYELDVIKSFDDVVVSYAVPIPDERGDLIQAEYYQVKFHVSLAGAFTWEALVTPEFIGASSVSFLQRLHMAQQMTASAGQTSRFHMLAPWTVHPDDPLASLVSNQGGEIRLQVLFDGTGSRSAMGRIRSAWKTHLGLRSDKELERLLRPLRIHANKWDLDSLRDRLNDKLRLAGLSPVEAGCQVHPYDDLIRKVHATGQKEFTSDQIREICEREGLWRGILAQEKQAVQVGIRSFMRWAEHMEDETDYMLCLVRHFDNRNIREPMLWQEAVFPELESFLSKTLRRQQSYNLHLDTHTSIAFAIGYCLDPKSGIDVAPLQRTQSGSSLWQPLPGSAVQLPTWSLEEIVCASGGSDVALAIGVTHDVLNDVQIYVSNSLPSVRRILSCKIRPYPSSSAVRDGTHALSLAQELVSIVRQNRSTEERKSALHVFAAAPNGVVFFLGQLARSLGECVIYEYQFDRSIPGQYQPSLKFPPQPNLLKSQKQQPGGN